MKNWLSTLLFFATLILAAENLEKGKSMALPPAAVTCPQVSDDYMEQLQPSENAQTLVFDQPKQFTRAAQWRGKEDFSVRFTFGWNQSGLCFFFDVTDSEVVNDMEKNVDLWRQDSVELFIAAPEGRKLGNNTLAFERFQLILSLPDETGKIRSFTLYDSAYGPDITYRASGERTVGGYRIRLLIPYSVFGDYDLAKEGLFRMQFNCNDYDRRDGKALPPRKVSIGRATQPSASAVDYPLFRFCRSDADNPERSLAAV